MTQTTSPSTVEGVFRRFTNLASTIHLLQTNRITLLPPDSWDDQNDRHFMDVYKKRKALKTLTALCLSQAPETYHHWRVFSPNSDGVCLLLNREKLLKAFDDKPGVRHHAVRYKEISRLPNLNPAIDELPFIKRYPYEPESEYRIICESSTRKDLASNFDLLLGTIEAVILSPWMPQALVTSVQSALRKINTTGRTSIYASTLISNSDWQKVADRAV
ncbi:DUF2971 domain-containing protein [Rhizobium rhizogenes]|uniref:DUF2971 domain-containing protein n=1 Tax=Rhizobium rhizogenes TaxID=359 RepID=UPI00157239B9|nr:DUF2971 domain-containing protein [Rhizobium rhizogenes]NTF51009.1 DUF2971 domain-containing protein [Rhizobium rhizogenes]NTH08387.1 DUF2971 domain-containing protein [Rhizobium rhizogenes]